MSKLFNGQQANPLILGALKFVFINTLLIRLEWF